MAYNYRQVSRRILPQLLKKCEDGLSAFDHSATTTKTKNTWSRTQIQKCRFTRFSINVSHCGSGFCFWKRLWRRHIIRMDKLNYHFCQNCYSGFLAASFFKTNRMAIIFHWQRRTNRPSSLRMLSDKAIYFLSGKAVNPHSADWTTNEEWKIPSFYICYLARQNISFRISSRLKGANIWPA